MINTYQMVIDSLLCLGSISTAIALVVLIFQTRINKMAVDDNRNAVQADYNWRRKDAAIEMTKYYMDEILPLAAYVNTMLVSSKKKEIRLHDIRLSEMNRFTNEELIQLSKIPDIPKHMNAQILSIEDHTFNIAKLLVPQNIRESLSEERISHFWGVCGHLLNRIEYFSMMFVSEIAEDKAVYDSLHQTFIPNIKMLYAVICIHNNRPEGKYFTNLISLFLKWRDRDERKKNTRIEFEENLSDGIGTV